MIDDFALGLVHLLLALAALHLIWRSDLDRETPADGGGGDGAKKDPRPARKVRRA